MYILIFLIIMVTNLYGYQSPDFSNLDFSYLNTVQILSNTSDSGSSDCYYGYSKVYDKSNYDEVKRINNKSYTQLYTYELKCSGVACYDYVKTIHGKVIYQRYIREYSYYKNIFNEQNTCSYCQGFTEGCNNSYYDCYVINSCTEDKLYSFTINRIKIDYDTKIYENAIRINVWFVDSVSCDLSCLTPYNSEVIKRYLIIVLPEKAISSQKFISSQNKVSGSNSSTLNFRMQRGITQYEK